MKRGTDIPLVARITRVTDSADSMLDDPGRPHRKGKGKIRTEEKGSRRIINDIEAKIQRYDPDIVNAVRGIFTDSGVFSRIIPKKRD